MIAFGALVAATVAAFFITQHLKVSTPLLAGFPRPVPGVISVGNCFEPNATAGGKVGVILRLASSSRIARRPSPPISS